MELPFEETWLISLCEREDRYKMMIPQFEELGWSVKDFRVVKHPTSDLITDLIGKDLNITGGGEFNCTREHYTLIKSAYLRGVKSICIIEDDVHFLKDKSIWKEYIDNLPKDWDILRICCHRNMLPPVSKYWTRCVLPLFGTGCYALSRKGMEYMINSIDNKYQPIDVPLFEICKDKSIQHYICATPLGIHLEDPYNGDINNYTNNKSWLNYTKFLDKNNYF